MLSQRAGVSPFCLFGKTHFLSGTQENLKFSLLQKHTNLIYSVTKYDMVSYSSFINKRKLLGNVFFSILRKIVYT